MEPLTYMENYLLSRLKSKWNFFHVVSIPGKKKKKKKHLMLFNAALKLKIQNIKTLSVMQTTITELKTSFEKAHLYN